MVFLLSVNFFQLFDLSDLYIFEHLSLHIHFRAFKPSYTFLWVGRVLPEAKFENKWTLFFLNFLIWSTVNGQRLEIRKCDGPTDQPTDHLGHFGPFGPLWATLGHLGHFGLLWAILGDGLKGCTELHLKVRTRAISPSISFNTVQGDLPMISKLSTQYT